MWVFGEREERAVSPHDTCGMRLAHTAHRLDRKRDVSRDKGPVIAR